MEKKLTAVTQETCDSYWTNSGGNTPQKQQYGYLQPIMKNIHVSWTRNVGHCWRSMDELISDILLWTPSHGWAMAVRPARTDIQCFCADTGCILDYLPGVIDDRDCWQERVKEICASSVTWWWWDKTIIRYVYFRLKPNFFFLFPTLW